MPQNPFGPLRQQNIFGQMNQQEWNPYDDSTGPMPVQQPDMDFTQLRMRQLYQPETQNIDRFNNMMNQFPVRQEPNTMQKIAASFMGIGKGGPQMADQYLNRNFNQNLMDWKTQIEPAYQGANLERQNNMNERQMANQMVNQELQQRRIAETERNNMAKNEIAAKRAEIYAIKQMRPNMKFDFSGPEVLVADPTTGQVERTGVPTGSLSDADKIALSSDARLQQIAAAGNQARQTEGVRQVGREAIVEKKATLPPRSAAANRPESATQQRTRLYMNAQKLKNSRPDLAPFIKLDQQNNFTIAQPGPQKTGIMGMLSKSAPTAEQYAEMNKLVYGTEPPAMGRSNAPVNEPSANTGERKVGETKRFPNGRVGRWDGKGWVAIK